MKKTGLFVVALALAATMTVGCSSASTDNTTEESTTEVTVTETTIPENEQHYGKAEELAAEGKLEEAIAEYKLAEGFSDSNDKIFNIIHSQGEKALTDGKYEEAIDYYKKAGEYKDTSEDISGVYYTQGEKAFEAGEMDKAIGFFKDAGTYKDAATKVSEIAYGQAELALKNKDNVTAAKYFTEAGDYNDALNRAQTIYYNLGTASAKKKAYDEAIEYFTNAGEYKDAKSKLQAAHYNKGKDLIGKKQYEDGAKELKEAGDYAAAKKLLDSTITSLISGKDFDNAEKMADYCDPAVIEGLKQYIAGRKAYSAGEYGDAISKFEKAGETKDSATYIKASFYALGLDAIKKEDFDSAATCFKRSDDYKNSKALYNVSTAEYYMVRDNYTDAAKYYSKVSDKLKVDGVNIKSRKAFLSRYAAFSKIKGSYSVKSNNIKTTNIWKRDTRYKEYWYINTALDGQDLVLDFSVNDDGTMDLTGSVTFYHYTNYSSLRSLVEGKYTTVDFHLKNLKKIPTNVVIGSHLRLKYSKGKFSIVYYEKDNYSMYFYNVYQSTVTFKKDT